MLKSEEDRRALKKIKNRACIFLVLIVYFTLVSKC